MPWRTVALAAVVVAIAVGTGLAVGRWAFPAGRDAAPTPTTPRPQATGPGPGPAVVRFRDSASGLSLEYPADWAQRRPSDRGVRLLATGGAGGSLLLRIALLPFDASHARLPAVRQLGDAAVQSAGARVTVLDRRVARLGGLEGYRYVYRFRDGRRAGAHVEYFLLAGRSLVTLVLQAVPSAALPRLTPVFARIAASFRA